MSFVRVRSANPGDPQHVFDAPVGLVEANPDAYMVLDDVPVEVPRPVEYVHPAVAVIDGEAVAEAVMKTASRKKK